MAREEVNDYRRARVTAERIARRKSSGKEQEARKHSGYAADSNPALIERVRPFSESILWTKRWGIGRRQSSHGTSIPRFQAPRRARGERYGLKKTTPRVPAHYLEGGQHYLWAIVDSLAMLRLSGATSGQGEWSYEL